MMEMGRMNLQRILKKWIRKWAPVVKPYGSLEKILENKLSHHFVIHFILDDFSGILHWLVVSTHLKNMKVSWDDYSQDTEK